MIVYLIGYMGSGKSTAGKKLAGRLGWDFIDIDSVIEAREKRAISSIFMEDGEERFRIIESEVLREVVPSANTIVACGGGTPCFHDNMTFMNNHGYTIYLKLSPAAIKSRLKNSGKSRPLIDQRSDIELIDYLNDSLAEREPFYNLASLEVNGLSPDINQLSSHLLALSPYNPL